MVETAYNSPNPLASTCSTRRFWADCRILPAAAAVEDDRIAALILAPGPIQGDILPPKADAADVVAVVEEIIEPER